MHKNLKAITLMELLIGIVLMSIIVLGITNIDIFSRYHVLSAERRVKLQNEASFVLEHMSKQINSAIGNEMINNPSDPDDGVDSVIAIDDNANRRVMRIYIDASGNGQREAPKNNPNPTDDRWIAYRYQKLGSDRYQIIYCPRCQQKNNCNNCMGNAEETLATNISDFNPGKTTGSPLTNNSITVQISSRWDPDIAVSADNPEVTMRAEIKMPSVSTN